VLWVRFLEIFVDYVGFIEGPGSSVRLPAGNCWYQATWVECEEGSGLVVRIYFDVLIGDLFLFESDPDPLDCSTGTN
jgi:hypothetical protein